MKYDLPTIPHPLSRRAALGLAGGAFATLALPARRAAAKRLFPADGAVEFVARRQGALVGAHRFDFARRDGRFVVRSDIVLDVRTGGAPLLRFVHHAEESWLDGWLDTLFSDTDDDGRLFQVRAAREDGIFTGTINGAAFTVSGYIIPSSLWHRDTPDSQTLLDTVDGRVKVVRSELVGIEDVPAGDATVPARHYVIHGGIPRDVWYDEDYRLVRIALNGRDGVPIVFERQ
jgi:hypothetical protein